MLAAGNASTGQMQVEGELEVALEVPTVTPTRHRRRRGEVIESEDTQGGEQVK